MFFLKLFNFSETFSNIIKNIGDKLTIKLNNLYLYLNKLKLGKLQKKK